MTERMDHMPMEGQEQVRDRNMQHMPMHMNLIDTLNECEATCEHMVTHLLMHTDTRKRITQIQYLRDCADICTLTAKYVARMSAFSKWIANVCASICEMCANECMKFPDRESQECARICMHCARECRRFVMMQ